jgi:release factor glutamine methyltransferase
MTQRFEQVHLEAPRVVAEMLLSHVLDCERMRLYMEPDRPAGPDELERLRALVVRAGRHEPVQYLVGRVQFYGRELLVGPSTMVPQPCTEELVGLVLSHHPDARRPRRPMLDRAVAAFEAAASEAGEPLDAPAGLDDGKDGGQLDLATGSGCIAVTLALHLPAARVVATDIAPEAIELARANAERHGVADRVELLVGELFAPLGAPGGQFDWITANPPYVPDREWESDAVDRAVRDFVPARAIRGGADGLDVIRPLLASAGAWLRPGGRLAMEIGHDQGPAVRDLVDATDGLRNPEIHRDHQGHERILLAARA